MGKIKNKKEIIRKEKEGKYHGSGTEHKKSTAKKKATEIIK